jgi:hypothetical protein
MIIAETILYRKQRGTAQRVRIAIHRPERDLKPDGDVRCRVEITGAKPRLLYGVDSFQALNMAFVYLRTQAEGWMKRRQEWFFDRRLRFPYHIDVHILNDLTRFERPAPAKRRRK